MNYADVGLLCFLRAVIVCACTGTSRLSLPVYKVLCFSVLLKICKRSMFPAKFTWMPLGTAFFLPDRHNCLCDSELRKPRLSRPFPENSVPSCYRLQRCDRQGRCDWQVQPQRIDITPKAVEKHLWNIETTNWKILCSMYTDSKESLFKLDSFIQCVR